MSYSPRRLASSALALVALACSLTGRSAPGVTPVPSDVEGPVPSALDPPVGCRFHTRCPHKVGPICETTPPPKHTVSAEHRISCHISLAELRQTPPAARVGSA